MWYINCIKFFLKTEKDGDFGSQHRKVSDSAVLLLAEIFEKSINILAKALFIWINLPIFESPNFILAIVLATTIIVSTASSPIIAPSLASIAIPLSANNVVGTSGFALNIKITTFKLELNDVKLELRNVKSELGDDKNILNKILAAILGRQLPNAEGENSL